MTATVKVSALLKRDRTALALPPLGKSAGRRILKGLMPQYSGMTLDGQNVRASCSTCSFEHFRQLSVDLVAIRNLEVEDLEDGAE